MDEEHLSVEVAEQERDPLRYLYSIYYGNRKAAVLAVAVRYKIFDFIAAHEPDGVQQSDLVKQYQFSSRGAAALLLALERLHLLRLVQDRYYLSPYSRQYLTSTADEYIGSLIDLEYDEFITPNTLDAALRSGHSQAYRAAADVWQHHEVDQARCERFAAAMHAISSGPARALIQTLSQERHWGLDESLAMLPHRVLDVGGGSGCYAVEWMRHAPVSNSEAHILETPACSHLTERYVEESRSIVLPNTIHVHAGDMFVEEAYGEASSYTHVLMSQILHDWPVRDSSAAGTRRDGEHLVTLAWRALHPGGVLVIHEKLVRDADTAMVTLDMLHWTEGQQFTETMMRELLERAGFVRLRFRKTAHTYWWAVLAQRPDGVQS